MKIKLYIVTDLQREEGYIHTSDIIVDEKDLSSKAKKLIKKILSSDDDIAYNDLEKTLQDEGIITKVSTLQALMQID